MAIDWLKFDVSVIEVSTFFAFTKQTNGFDHPITNSCSDFSSHCATLSHIRATTNLPDKRFFDFSLSLESRKKMLETNSVGNFFGQTFRPNDFSAQK